MAANNPAQELHISDAWYETAQVVDRYEDEANGNLPDLSVLMKDVSQANRSAVLLELIQVDMEYRWKRGDVKTVQDYLQEFPELHDEPDSLVELFRSELDQARRSGNPQWQEKIRRQHTELAASEDTEDELVRSTAAFLEQTRPKKLPEIEGKAIGKYTVLNKLGEGGFGVVYRGRDPDLKRDVAIKIASRQIEGMPPAVETLRHEATAAAQIRHPNAVSVLGFEVTEDGRPYIVSEFVAGEPLRKRIKRKDYTLEEAICWVAEVAEALHAAHRKQVIHRDVKPENILINEEGIAQLTDFGLARHDDRFFLDDKDRFVGTAPYVSPEQADEKADLVTAASDIFSLGSVLYELLCQRPPFRGTIPGDVARQVLYRTPDPPRTINEHVPPEVEAVCLKAMAKNPEDRFKTAGDMASALRKAIRPRSHWLPMSLAAAAIFAALIIAGVLLGRPTSTAEPVRVLEPLVDVERPGETLPYRLPDVLPQYGDRLEVKAEASGPSYLWVILYSSSGDPQLLWPVDPSKVEPVRSAYCPPPEFGPVEMPDSEGVMVVLVGASPKRLSKDQLTSVLAIKPQSWPAPIRHKQLEAIIRPRPDQLGHAIPAHILVRGGDSPGTAEGQPYRFPPDFQGQVDEIFETYYAVMFSHFRRGGATE